MALIFKIFLNWFWKLHRSVVFKNIKLKGMHAGETCLIFGNGGSLKYYDFTALPNLPSICTAYSLVDKRMNKINIKYWVIPDPYVLYPFLLEKGKLRKNFLHPILKKIALINPTVILVTSLTHFYSFFPKMKEVVYFHHFGESNSSSSNLAGNFSTCTGSLDIMLGFARYLGFSKVILLGCDYLGSPKLEGHFYGDSVPSYGIDDQGYVARFKSANLEQDVIVILPKGSTCSIFKSATFEECFGVPDCYQENTEIIDKEYMIMMRKAEENNQIYM
jgi:hypothetical protein